MRTNTTPTMTFTLPMSVSSINNYSITYKQAGNIVLKKMKGDSGVTENETKIEILLTQAETALFTPDMVATAQFKIEADGNIAGSEIINIPVKDLYDKDEWEV